MFFSVVTVRGPLSSGIQFAGMVFRHCAQRVRGPGREIRKERKGIITRIAFKELNYYAKRCLNGK